MNIVIIMSGGVGQRFGAVIPKQYNLIAGRPVIDYVVDAVKESKLTDKVVVVMDPQWKGYSEALKNSDFDFTVNGETRIKSLYNGLKLIKDKSEYINIFKCLHIEKLIKVTGKRRHENIDGKIKI